MSSDDQVEEAVGTTDERRRGPNRLMLSGAEDKFAVYEYSRRVFVAKEGGKEGGSGPSDESQVRQDAKSRR